MPMIQPLLDIDYLLTHSHCQAVNRRLVHRGRGEGGGGSFPVSKTGSWLGHWCEVETAADILS